MEGSVPCSVLVTGSTAIERGWGGEAGLEGAEAVVLLARHSPIPQGRGEEGKRREARPGRHCPSCTQSHDPHCGHEESRRGGGGGAGKKYFPGATLTFSGPGYILVVTYLTYLPIAFLKSQVEMLVTQVPSATAALS